MPNNYEPIKFVTGKSVVALVNHSPEVKPGDLVKLVKSWNGYLCAVQLPNGMIHRWFAAFELSPIDNSAKRSLVPGSYVKVINVEGHGKPPHIKTGTRVKIVRCIETTFYDVTLSNGEYHRWLADFEVADPV